MSLTVLAIGDPHFQINNIPEVEMFMDRIENLANEHLPDKIVILGDLLHTHERLHTIPLNKAYEFIKRMREIAPTYVIVGNHDYIGNQQHLTSNHWMNGMKEWENVTIIDKAIYESESGFTYCPYVPPGRFREALDTIGVGGWEEECKVIFCHQEFFGCKMGAIVSAEGDRWSKNGVEIISGHIHDRQQPQPNIYYTGSSMQHAFGESPRKTVVLLTFEEGADKYQLNEINLDLPKKKIVYMDVNDVDNFEVKETKDHIKVSITGSYDEFKALKKTKKYKDLVGSGVKVVFKPEKLVKKDKGEEGKEEELGPIVDSSAKFETILADIVSGASDPYLYQAYQFVVKKTRVEVDDVMFLPTGNK